MLQEALWWGSVQLACYNYSSSHWGVKWLCNFDRISCSLVFFGFFRFFQVIKFSANGVGSQRKCHSSSSSRLSCRPCLNWLTWATVSPPAAAARAGLGRPRILIGLAWGLGPDDDYFDQYQWIVFQFGKQLSSHANLEKGSARPQSRISINIRILQRFLFTECPSQRKWWDLRNAILVCKALGLDINFSPIILIRNRWVEIFLLIHTTISTPIDICCAGKKILHNFLAACHGESVS